MDTILITTLVITVIGLIVGLGLVFTGKKFKVEVDEREVKVREALPGNNCGACGFAGCDAMAAAIVKGDAPVNGCPVGGAKTAEEIAAVMGKEALPSERKVAFVKCKGTCEATKNQAEFFGVRDCKSIVLNGLRPGECDYGCLGYGTCVSVCPEHAIHVIDGVAVVDRNQCVGCGLCVKACPKQLIELIPADQFVAVQCSNRDPGVIVRKVCKNGCIGCGICVRKCGSEAVTVEGNLAHVNYEACVQCAACVEACPQKIITAPLEGRENG